VTLGGAPVEGRFRATVLDGDSPDAFNSVEQPDRVNPRAIEFEFRGGRVSLPPHSLCVVEVSQP